MSEDTGESKATVWIHFYPVAKTDSFKEVKNSLTLKLDFKDLWGSLIGWKYLLFVSEFSQLNTKAMFFFFGVQFD